jgi:SAM-dependent methyltransferase
MSWTVTKDEWLTAVTQAPIAEPVAFPIDEFDAHLCGVLGVSADAGEQSAPSTAAPAEPEPLDVTLQPAQAAPSGEHLEVAIEPAPAADFSAPMPSPPEPDEQAAVPEPVEETGSPLPEPPPFAVPTSELPPDPTPVSGIGIDEPMGLAGGEPDDTEGSPQPVEVPPAEASAAAEQQPAVEQPPPSQPPPSQPPAEAPAAADPSPAPEEPVPTLGEAAPTVEEPAAMVDEAAATVEEPAATVDEAAATVEEPAATVDEAAATVEEPTATVEEPPSEAEAPASDGVPEPVADGAEPKSGAMGVNEAVTTESGPIDVSSAPSLFMPASLLRPKEEEPLEEPPPEEKGAVPEPVAEEHELDSGEVAEVLDAEDVEEELDAADLEEDERPVAEDAAAPPPKPPPPSPPSAAARRRNWWDDVFTEHYSTISTRGVAESAERDVEFVVACTEPPEGGTVLEVGCGVGHHALKFAARGYQVTGVDSSLAQLLRASELNEEHEAGVAFMHGDMRELPTQQEYDLVTCLGTTIGYFEEDANRQVLEEMRDRIAPGGRLMLQVFNRDYLVSKLPIRSWWQGNKCLVLDEAELNYKANRLRIHRTVVFEDGRQFEHYMFMRAYSVHDLGKALSSAGLKVLQLSGSRETRGRFYGSASPDIWIVAQRREE